MLDAITAFFSSFNPIVFGGIMSLGAIILFRRPAAAPALRTVAERERSSAGSVVRRPQ